MKKALVLAFAAVMIFGAAAFADMLSGNWSTGVCMDGTGTFTLFTSTLTVNYEVCNWLFGAALGFGVGGWETVSFTADGVLGAFSISSEVIFDPQTALFVSWDNTLSISLAGVDIDIDFYMDATPFILATVGISGDVGLCTLGIEAIFGGECEFGFLGVCFEFGFPFACVEWIDVEVCFGCGTFEGICFDIAGLQLSGIDWLVFDLTICFDDGEAGKTFTFVPGLSLGAYDCITLYAELVTDGDIEFDGIDVYGVGIYYEWNGVYFESVTSFDPDKNAALIGDAAYWEKLCIGSVGDSCCGGGFDFNLCIYFDVLSPFLFDVGLVEADLGFGIGSNFLVTGSLSITPGGGLVEICLGFDVSW
jgi:hypothetical protein